MSGDQGCVFSAPWAWVAALFLVLNAQTAARKGRAATSANTRVPSSVVMLAIPGMRMRAAVMKYRPCRTLVAAMRATTSGHAAPNQEQIAIGAAYKNEITEK